MYNIDIYAELVSGSYTDEEMLLKTKDFLAHYGFSDFNYFNSDPNDQNLRTSKFSLNSTLSPEWMQYYEEQGYQYVDHMAEHIRSGHRTPILGGTELKKYIKNLTDVQKTVMEDGGRAGFYSGVCLPVASLAHIEKDFSGFTLISQDKEDKFMKMLSQHGFELGLFLNAIHQNIGNKFLGKAAGFKALSPREGDCLKYMAQGLRVTALAYKLDISEVTVNFHLKNARVKLKSRTLTEAIAKAIQYKMITL